MQLERKQLVLVGLWYLLLVAAYLVYEQGINNRFYFDDYANLPALGETGEVDSFEDLKVYVQSNAAGPTGRPISVLSFLIDDNTWPSNASEFKETNLLIHLLIGCLVFWASILIIEALTKIRPEFGLPWWSSILVAGFWLVNPLHVSTVLYPVQRMAQLSTLFTVAGILAFLKIRPLISRKAKAGVPLLFACLTPLYFLAVFSKENGVLLPLFLLVLEVFVLRKAYPMNPKLDLVFRVCVWGVLACILGIILYKASVNGWFTAYPGRDFTPLERLITQPLVLFLYLRELFIPGLYTPALYYDDFQHLTLSNYGQVLFYLVGLLGLAFFGFKGLKQSKPYGIAFSFFLVGHLLESTALNLELVFEHRNYLASAFIGFVLLSIVMLLRRTRIPAVLVPLLVLLLYPLPTLTRAQLWGEPLEFGAVLAKLSPHSIRSQIELNNALVDYGMIEKARSHMRQATMTNPESLYLAIHMVLLDCMESIDQSDSYEKLIALASEQSFDGRNRLAIDALWKFMERKQCNRINPEFFNELIDAFHIGETVGKTQSEASRRGLRIITQRFYLRYPEFAPGEIQPLSRVLESRNPEYLMLSAATVASVGRYREALMLADRARELVLEGELGTSNRSKQSFLMEIEKFQDTVRADLD
ncbi:hypothetical protein MD273_05095 [Marinobacter pelagius]|uniref:hypothetical protein n=1 Tax=Marinobacter sp. C7 TaxID=2951363 RepID=UPI001EEFDD48|nr:hypothetical protein [Marinobacter sp. C7]MCG7199102.1 hypothetical protein [Marinobacter sp. C7]